jgi:hypothetical protein
MRGGLDLACKNGEIFHLKNMLLLLMSTLMNIFTAF